MTGRTTALAIAAGAWLVAGLIAFLLVASTGFGVICVIGLMLWFVAARIDPDKDAPVGNRLPHLIVGERDRMPDDVRAGWQQGHSPTYHVVRFFRHLGMALTLIGAACLIWFQLLH